MKRALITILHLSTTGCAFADLRHGVVDFLVDTAFRPRPSRGVIRRGSERLELLAGDLHCHVRPPDGAPHVVRGLRETLKLARQEALDFVVLTPHVRARYYTSKATRRAVLEEHLRLGREIEALDADDVLMIPGFEYTDYGFGHAGMAFGDLEKTFDRVPPRQSALDPASLFDAFQDTGGLLVINHPLLLPIESPLAVSSWDLSWRLLNGASGVPDDIRAIDDRADAFEAFNLAVTHLRDRFLVGDHRDSLATVFERFDRRIRDQKRRQTPVGGSDSHGHHLRATTFVWSRSRTTAAIGKAIRRGRTCVRSPEACAFTARAVSADEEQRQHRPQAIVGDSLRGRFIEVANEAAESSVLVDGRYVGTTVPGRPLRVEVAPATCSVLRSIAGGGYSAPIYLNCPFAEADRPPTPLARETDGKPARPPLFVTLFDVR